MQLITATTPHVPLPPSVATIGCFDGVHRGHSYLIEQVCRAAAQQGLHTAVVTFPVPPRIVMNPEEAPRLLTSREEKLQLLQQTPVDYCIELPFTRELSLLSAHQFMQLLHERYHIQTLLIGYDHRFGHNRAESFVDYQRYGHELGMEVLRADGLAENGITISSSLIRSLLSAGNLEQANHYLGYAYRIEGSVVDGYKIGRSIGFPTANLSPFCAEKLIPAHGVYAVYAEVDGERYPGMLNIGLRPTLNNGNNVTIEVHLIDFCRNIYHHRMCITFEHPIRAEQKFESLDALVRQLHADEMRVRELLTDHT